MSPGARSPGPSAAAYFAAAAALGVAALACIWAPAAPVGTDLPTHLYFARVIAAPDAFAGMVEVGYTPTAQLWVWLVAPLTHLGPVVAGKIGLTLLAALTALGFAAVGRALGDRRPAAALLGIAATQSWFVAMGFVNFVLGAAIGLFALAAAIRAWDAPTTGRPRWWIGLALLMLLAAHAHVMAAGMTGILIAALALGWRSAARIRRTLGTVAALAPAGAFSLVVALAARAEYAEDVAEGLSTQRLPWGEVLGNVAFASFGGFSLWGPPLVVLAWAGAAMRAGERRDGGGLAAPLALASAVWLVAYAVVPFHGWGWAFAQPRALWPLVFGVGAFAGWGRRPNAMLAAITTAGLLFLGSSAVEEVRVGAEVRAQIDAFGEAPPGRAMEVVLAPGSTHHPAVEPLLHTGQYALWNGGVSPLLPPYSAMIHSVHALGEMPPHTPMFIYRALACDEPAACDEAFVNLAQRIAAQGLHFDTVVLVGAAAASQLGDDDRRAERDANPGRSTESAARWREAMQMAGYVEVAPAVWRPRPSVLRIALHPPPAAAARPLIIRVGYPDGFGWITGAQRPPSPPSESPESLILGPLPAGPITVETLLAPAPGAPTATRLGAQEVDVPAGGALALDL